MSSEDQISVYPHPLRLIRGLLRPNKPFVMVNLLKYKAVATGEFAHLSGREAYSIYGESVGVAQAPLGSKLLWAGEVVDPAEHDPILQFDTVALMQYASPLNFVRFATGGGGNSRARAAGLLGQWLLASTTLYHQPSHTPSADEIAVMICHSAPTSTEALLASSENKLIWHGQVDQQALGNSKKPIKQVSVLSLGDLQIESIRSQFPDSLIYQARTQNLLPSLA